MLWRCDRCGRRWCRMARWEELVGVPAEAVLQVALRLCCRLCVVGLCWPVQWVSLLLESQRRIMTPLPSYEHAFAVYRVRESWRLCGGMLGEEA